MLEQTAHNLRWLTSICCCAADKEHHTRELSDYLFIVTFDFKLNRGYSFPHIFVCGLQSSKQ